MGEGKTNLPPCRRRCYSAGGLWRRSLGLSALGVAVVSFGPSAGQILESPALPDPYCSPWRPALSDGSLEEHMGIRIIRIIRTAQKLQLRQNWSNGQGPPKGLRLSRSLNTKTETPETRTPPSCRVLSARSTSVLKSLYRRVRSKTEEAAWVCFVL